VALIHKGLSDANLPNLTFIKSAKVYHSRTDKIPVSSVIELTFVLMTISSSIVTVFAQPKIVST
jgi:hypothetical protein